MIITDVTFKDFEVAAVSLNNVDNLVIKDCVVDGNRHDVPVVGLFSAARFIRYVVLGTCSQSVFQNLLY